MRSAQHLVIIDRNGSFNCQGTPSEIITKDILREVYGVIANVTHDENGIPVVSPIRSIRSF